MNPCPFHDHGPCGCAGRNTDKYIRIVLDNGMEIAGNAPNNEVTLFTMTYESHVAGSKYTPLMVITLNGHQFDIPSDKIAYVCTGRMNNV